MNEWKPHTIFDISRFGGMTLEDQLLTFLNEQNVVDYKILKQNKDFTTIIYKL